VAKARVESLSYSVSWNRNSAALSPSWEFAVHLACVVKSVWALLSVSRETALNPFRSSPIVTYHFHVADLLQCNVRPVYRDPIHDFGFLKFDPEAIKHIPVKALQLRPDSAKVGVEIKEVGNDGGEKLSILSGFICRIDRNAPEYAEGNYRDFNINYILQRDMYSLRALGISNQ
jgi:hypothetical protein